ncbi:MAG TPA: hypothetical protein DCQ77_09160 [Betaproteobacteria bacterium]|nr:hypothetical protein [Betaproteobacteria bacterium]
MKRFLIAAAIAAATVTTPALAADVGVSVSIGQPGFYGRLDIGGYPQPQVIYRQPIAIQRVPAHRPPIYLRVPPGHAKHWSKHCREYNACGERVYFVQDNWYNREYVPRYQKQHRDRRGDRRDEHGNDNRGNHGNGHGNDRGHGRDH